MNFDVNNVVKKLRKLETTLKTKIESGALYSEVRRYADGKAKNLRQKVKGSKDAKKLLAFIDQRKKQIEKIARDLPGEVQSVKAYVKSHRKELEKLGNQLIKDARAGKINATSLRSAIRAATGKRASGTKAKATKKTATRKRAKKH